MKISDIHNPFCLFYPWKYILWLPAAWGSEGNCVGELERMENHFIALKLMMEALAHLSSLFSVMENYNWGNYEKLIN